MQVEIKARFILEMGGAVRLTLWNSLTAYVTSHKLLSLTCRRMPSLLEYLSYNCNFMGILAGPLCSYKDYITFIEGRSYQVTQSGESGKEELHCARAEPSPNVSKLMSLSGTFFFF